MDFSRKITRPVMELARLSEDMANLNFDMKYTSGGNNEIGILGRTLIKCPCNWKRRFRN